MPPALRRPAPRERAALPETPADRRHGNDPGDAVVLRTAAADAALLAERCPRTAQLVSDFLASLQHRVEAGTLAPATVAVYARSLRPWLRFCAHQRIDAPTAADVAACRDALATTRAPAGVNAVLDALRALDAWAVPSHRPHALTAGIAWLPYPRGPTAPVLPRRLLARLTRLLPEDDLRGRRDRALLTLLLDTGIATISAQRATWGALDLVTGTLAHQPQGHRAPDVRVALAPATRLALLRYREALPLPPLSADPLFHRIRRGGHPAGRLSTLSMRLTVLRLCERAGLAQRDRHGRLLQPGVFGSGCLVRAARAARSPGEAPATGGRPRRVNRHPAPPRRRRVR